MIHTFRELLLGLIILLFNFHCLAQEAAYDPGLLEKRTSALQAEGIDISFIQEGEGILPMPGDILEFHMKGSLSDGKVFYSNYSERTGIITSVGIGRMVPGLDQGLLLMNVGSRAVFKIPSDKAYGKEGLPGLVPANTDVVIEIEVLKHSLSLLSVLKFQTQGKDTLEGKNGLGYIEVHKTFLPKPKKGDLVWVHYTAMLPDGTIFDACLLDEDAFSFVLGESAIIQGWNIGLSLMSTGDKFRFLIPWKLAYGKKGFPGKIPSKTNLIFDIELVRFESLK